MATSPVVVTDDVAARLSVMRASLARVTRPVTTAVPVIVVAVVTLTLLVHTRVLATRPPVKATVPPVEKIHLWKVSSQWMSPLRPSRC